MWELMAKVRMAGSGLLQEDEYGGEGQWDALPRKREDVQRAVVAGRAWAGGSRRSG